MEIVTLEQLPNKLGRFNVETVLRWLNTLYNEQKERLVNSATPETDQAKAQLVKKLRDDLVAAIDIKDKKEMQSNVTPT